VRTARYAIARSTRWTDGDDCLIGDTPTCRSTSFGHRFVLDSPPWDDWAGWFQRWREVHAGKGVATAYLCFEAKGTPETPASPPGVVAYTLSSMLLDPDAFASFEPRPLPDGLTMRPVVGEDWLALRDLAVAVNGWEEDPSGRAYLDWALEERRAQVEGGRAAQRAVFNGEKAVAAAAVVEGPADARYQDVQTHPDHRGRGLATALVAELARGRQGALWIVAERGSQPERIYDRVGFRTETTAFEFGHPSPRTDAEIEAIARALEDGTLALADWHHREHLLVAAWLLRTESTFDAALDRLRAALKTFLAAQGIETTQTAGYHETITRAWLTLVQREFDPALSLQDAALKASLALGDKLLLQHWKRETLMSWDSRRAWVEPDLTPLG